VGGRNPHPKGMYFPLHLREGLISLYTERDPASGLQSDFKWVAVISAKNQRQRRKRQPVTAKREKSQTPKVLTVILTLPNLT